MLVLCTLTKRLLNKKKEENRRASLTTVKTYHECQGEEVGEHIANESNDQHE